MTVNITRNLEDWTFIECEPEYFNFWSMDEIKLGNDILVSLLDDAIYVWKKKNWVGSYKNYMVNHVNKNRVIQLLEIKIRDTMFSILS